MRPGILLLDEPTANLDPAGVVEWDAERAPSSGSTLIVVEHRVAVWADLVDRVVVLEPGGGVAFDGPPAEVFAAHGEPPHAPRASGCGPPAAATRRARRRRGDVLVRARARGRRAGSVVRRGSSWPCAPGRPRRSRPNGSGEVDARAHPRGTPPPAEGEVDASAIARGLGPAPVRWRSRDLASRIGTVFQEPGHQFVAGSVRAELEVGARAIGASEADTAARVAELAERLRLDRLLDANPFTLSGGEQRRLCVAAILIARPDVLILDEPTFGQDARTWAELVAIVGALRDEGRAIAAVTHDRDFVAAAADVEAVLA